MNWCCFIPPGLDHSRSFSWGLLQGVNKAVKCVAQHWQQTRCEHVLLMLHFLEDAHLVSKPLSPSLEPSLYPCPAVMAPPLWPLSLSHEGWTVTLVQSHNLWKSLLPESFRFTHLSFDCIWYLVQRFQGLAPGHGGEWGGQEVLQSSNSLFKTSKAWKDIDRKMKNTSLAMKLRLLMDSNAPRGPVSLPINVPSIFKGHTCQELNFSGS